MIPKGKLAREVLGIAWFAVWQAAHPVISQVVDFPHATYFCWVAKFYSPWPCISPQHSNIQGQGHCYAPAHAVTQFLKCCNGPVSHLIPRATLGGACILEACGMPS